MLRRSFLLFSTLVLLIAFSCTKNDDVAPRSSNSPSSFRNSDCRANQDDVALNIPAAIQGTSNGTLTFHAEHFNYDSVQAPGLPHSGGGYLYYVINTAEEKVVSIHADSNLVSAWEGANLDLINHLSNVELGDFETISAPICNEVVTEEPPAAKNWCKTSSWFRKTFIGCWIRHNPSNRLSCNEQYYVDGLPRECEWCNTKCGDYPSPYDK